MIEKESLAVFVSVQISQTNDAELEHSPLDDDFLLRFPKDVFMGVKLRIRTSSSSSVSERLMTWTGLEAEAETPSYCSTEIAFDFVVPCKEIGVVKKEESTSKGGIRVRVRSLFFFLSDVVSRFIGVAGGTIIGGGGGGGSGFNIWNRFWFRIRFPTLMVQ